MRFNFFRYLDEVRGKVSAELYICPEFTDPGFPVHPSASDLAEQMLIDPDVLKNETYEPGLFDEIGDYYPQYSDDPSKLPEYFEPAPLDSGDTVSESLPAPTVDVSTGEVKKSE